MPNEQPRWTLPGRRRLRLRLPASLVAILAILGGPIAGVATGETSRPLRAEARPVLTPAQLTADLEPQVVPPDSALTVALDLELFRSYSLPLRVPSAGRLFIGWYQGRHPALPNGTTNLRLVASGHTRFGYAHRSQLPMTVTTLGRRLIQSSRSLPLTAVAFFTPKRQRRVEVIRPFTLA
jgi:hypothetical protein